MERLTRRLPPGVTVMAGLVAVTCLAPLGFAQTPQPAPKPDFVGISIAIDGQPGVGSPSAALTLVEISDFHCPFCWKQARETMPRVVREYVDTGKVRYVFVHYPIASLHPRAARVHEAAACAHDQGRFWEMHRNLFGPVAALGDAALIDRAEASGLDMPRFKSCLADGTHAGAISASVASVRQLGITSTPMVLLGPTPAPGQPLKVTQFIRGAEPYAHFKKVLDGLLTRDPQPPAGR